MFNDFLQAFPQVLALQRERFRFESREESEFCEVRGMPTCRQPSVSLVKGTVIVEFMGLWGVLMKSLCPIYIKSMQKEWSESALKCVKCGIELVSGSFVPFWCLPLTDLPLVVLMLA